MYKKLPRDGRNYIITNIIFLLSGLCLSELLFFLTLKHSIPDSIKWVMLVVLFLGLIFRFLWRMTRIALYTKIRPIDNGARFFNILDARLIVKQDDDLYTIVYVNKFDKEYSLNGQLYTGHKIKRTLMNDSILSDVMEKPNTMMLL